MKRLSEIKVKKQSEVLTDDEMKRIVGGGGECWFLCYCTRDSGPPAYFRGDCSGPWDRTSRCETGLQNCYDLGSA